MFTTYREYVEIPPVSNKSNPIQHISIFKFLLFDYTKTSLSESLLCKGKNIFFKVLDGFKFLLFSM